MPLSFGRHEAIKYENENVRIFLEEVDVGNKKLMLTSVNAGLFAVRFSHQAQDDPTLEIRTHFYSSNPGEEKKGFIIESQAIVPDIANADGETRIFVSDSRMSYPPRPSEVERASKLITQCIEFSYLGELLRRKL